jgi:nucleolin
MTNAEMPPASATPAPAVEDDGTRLFVGNLSWGTTDASLNAAFSAPTPGSVVSANVIVDRRSGRNKGFGFVAFSDAASAAAALAALDGVEVDGRAVRVSAAGPRPTAGEREEKREEKREKKEKKEPREKKERKERVEKPAGTLTDESARLFVGSLAWITDDASLMKAFDAPTPGSVTDAKVLFDRYNARSKGFGFVTFNTAAAAEKALSELNGVEIDGRAVSVAVASART